eukprot:scaffold3469_cov246-Pinguiococcus_pyrenoidosus.AAC.4
MPPLPCGSSSSTQPASWPRSSPGHDPFRERVFRHADEALHDVVLRREHRHELLVHILQPRDKLLGHFKELPKLDLISKLVDVGVQLRAKAALNLLRELLLGPLHLHDLQHAAQEIWLQDGDLQHLEEQAIEAPVEHVVPAPVVPGHCAHERHHVGVLRVRREQHRLALVKSVEESNRERRIHNTQGDDLGVASLLLGRWHGRRGRVRLLHGRFRACRWTDARGEALAIADHLLDVLHPRIVLGLPGGAEMQGACGKLDVDRLRKRPFRRAFAVGPFSNGTSFRQIEHRRRLGIVRAPVVLQDAEHLMIRQDEQPALPFGRRAEQLATSRLHQPAPPHFAVRAWRGRGMAILCRRVGLFGLAQGSSRLALGARRPHLAFVGDVHAEAEGPPESVGMAARHVDHRRLETAILIQDIRQGGSQRLLVRGYLLQGVDSMCLSASAPASLRVLE